MSGLGRSPSAALGMNRLLTYRKAGARLAWSFYQYLGAKGAERPGGSPQPHQRALLGALEDVVQCSRPQ